MKLKLLFFFLVLSKIIFAQTFTEVNPVPPFEKVAFSAVAFADVDGDNDEDVIVAGLKLVGEITKLYSNDGIGNFSEVTNLPFEGVGEGSVAFADIDGDNDQDVLITGRNNSLIGIAKLYINDGNGNFSELIGTPFEGVKTSSIAFADVDGDNDQDVLITGRNNSLLRIAKLYINDGNGNFSELIGTPFEGTTGGSIAFADVDGDNDQDVLITGRTSSSTQIANLYINDGNGNFSEVLNTPFEGVSLSSIAFSDIDNDDDLDLLITGGSSVGLISNLYVNGGDGTFTEILNTPFDGVHFSSVAFSDIDSDNDQDILITGLITSGEPISKLFTNNGNGNFSEVIGTPFIGVFQGSIAFADLDGDNDQDVLFTGKDSLSQPIAKLYTNNGTGVSTDDLITRLNLSILTYPNPISSTILNVSFNSPKSSIASIEIYDLNGDLLGQQKESIVSGQQSIFIDVAFLASGNYYLKIFDEKSIGYAKFIVQ